MNNTETPNLMTHTMEQEREIQRLMALAARPPLWPRMPEIPVMQPITTKLAELPKEME